MPITGDFYEDDEPIEKIREIWEAGEKALTAPPPDGAAQVNTPEAELGTTERQFDAMWQQGIPVTITTGTSTGYQPNSEVDRLRADLMRILRALFPVDPPTEVTPAVLHNAIQEASALHDAQAGNLRELAAARGRVAERDETIGELKEELALAQKVAGAADHLLAGHEIQPTTINTWLAHRFRTMVETRDAQLATAQQRIDELDAAAVANARRWTQELGRLGLRANTADTQLVTALDRLDQVRGELTTTQRDHAAAIARIRDLRAAATAAHQRADELAAAALTVDRDYMDALARATAAEAQVAAVREALDELDAEWRQLEQDPSRGPDTMGRADGLRDAAERLECALDAAGTPESATHQPSAQVGDDVDEPGTAKPPVDLIEACRQRLKDQHEEITGDYSGDPAEEEPYQDAGKPWFWDEWAESWAAFVLAASTPGISAGISGATPSAPVVTDAMVQAAINAALDHVSPDGRIVRDAHRQHTFYIFCDVCQLTNKHPEVSGPARERVFRAALEAALGTPAAEPDASLTPHNSQDCPNRIEVTGWGMTDRERICGCDPRPDATAPAETTSPSEAP